MMILIASFALLTAASLGQENVRSGHCIRQGSECPARWSKYNGFCYHFSTHNATWLEGKCNCQALGADYVVVRDMDENNFLKDKVLSFDYWLAGTDCLDEVYWIWKLATSPLSFWRAPGKMQSQMAFKNWKKGKPNKKYGYRYCAALRGRHPHIGKWEPHRCKNSKRYICKKAKDQTWKSCQFHCIKQNQKQTGVHFMPWKFTTQQLNSQTTPVNISIPEELQMNCITMQLEDTEHYEICLDRIPTRNMIIFSDVTKSFIPMSFPYSMQSTLSEKLKQITPCFMSYKSVNETETLIRTTPEDGSRTADAAAENVNETETLIRTTPEDGSTTADAAAENAVTQGHITVGALKTTLAAAVLGVLNVIQVIIIIIGTFLYYRKRYTYHDIGTPHEQGSQFNNLVHAVPEEPVLTDKESIPSYDTAAAGVTRNYENIHHVHSSQTSSNAMNNITHDALDSANSSQQYEEIL